MTELGPRSEENSIDEMHIPGTVHLVDVEGCLDVKKDKNSGNIILQPQPSSNPNDPLRWSKSKKRQQFWLLWIWSFILAVAVNFWGPLFGVWVVELNCNLAELNIFAAILFLFLGIGCVFLQPTAMKLGRRFVYLICTIIMIVANIIGSQAKSIQVLYITNILAGFAGAPIDSLVEISTTDVFFQHERAEYLSWFIFVLYAGSDLGPVASGFIVEAMNWRWCYYFLIIFSSVLFIIQVFFMEDTTFERLDNDLETDILSQIKSRETFLSRGDLAEMPAEVSSKNNYLPFIQDVSASLKDYSDSIDHFIPLRTYWQRIKLFELEYNDSRPWITIFYKPFFLISFPAIIWSGIIYGCQMMWLSLLGTTQSQIYSSFPYNFSASSVGLTNLGALVGSIAGMFYGGKFIDYVTIRLALKNNGILEPEFRLWTMALPTIFNAAGLLAYGLGSYYQAHWTISVILGQGLIGFAMSSSGAICITYSIDSYPKLASESLVLMLFIRNCIGCGFTFAIQPWLDRCGLRLTTWLMFMLSLVVNGSFIIMIKWGKDFRRVTSDRYYGYSRQ